MAFTKKNWKDRITEFPTRRTLTKSDGSTELVTVARAEGTVSQEGDAFSAENMNDLETRIGNEFGKINNSLTANNSQFYFDYQDGKYGYNTDPNRGADTFHPFSSGIKLVAHASGNSGSGYGSTAPSWSVDNEECVTANGNQLTFEKDGTYIFCFFFYGITYGASGFAKVTLSNGNVLSENLANEPQSMKIGDKVSSFIIYNLEGGATGKSAGVYIYTGE